MQPKLLQDDSVYVCKRGMLISLAWSVHKLDSFLRFTNDDHYGKFCNRIFFSKHDSLCTVSLEALSGFDVHENKSGGGGAIKSYANNEDEFLGELPITVEVFGYFH